MLNQGSHRLELQTNLYANVVKKNIQLHTWFFTVTNILKQDHT